MPQDDSDLFGSARPAPPGASAPPRAGKPDAGANRAPAAPRAALEAAPAGGALWLGCAAGVAAAVVAAAGYYFLATWLGRAVTPSLIVGPLVGLAIRLSARSDRRRLSVIAAVLASLAFIGGFVAIDVARITPFMLEKTIGRLFFLDAIIFHVVAVHLAYIIATRSPGLTVDQPRSREGHDEATKR